VPQNILEIIQQGDFEEDSNKGTRVYGGGESRGFYDSFGANSY